MQQPEHNGEPGCFLQRVTPVGSAGPWEIGGDVMNSSEVGRRQQAAPTRPCWPERAGLYRLPALSCPVWVFNSTETLNDLLH